MKKFLTFILTVLFTFNFTLPVFAFETDKDIIKTLKYYNDIKPLANNLFVVTVNGKKGLYSDTKEIYPPIYTDITEETYGIILTSENGNKSLLTYDSDNSLRLITKDIKSIDKLCYHLGEYYKIEIGNKYGLEKFDRKTLTLRNIFPYEYDNIVKATYNDDLLFLQKDDKYLIFDYTTEKIIAEFDFVSELNKKILKVGKDGKYGFYDVEKNKTGKIIYEDVEIIHAGYFNHEVYKVMKNKKWKNQNALKSPLTYCTIDAVGGVVVIPAGILMSAIVFPVLIFTFMTDSL
ncbi:WG repeat-containing protein [bacterium]|nr:WG repeat-containing protein [bacterium]